MNTDPIEYPRVATMLDAVYFPGGQGISIWRTVEIMPVNGIELGRPAVYTVRQYRPRDDGTFGSVMEETANVEFKEAVALYLQKIEQHSR